MSTPTLKALVAEAEQLLNEHAEVRTFAEWQAEADALFAEVSGDPTRAMKAYLNLLELPESDPATAPPRPQGYREQTLEEIYVAMVCGYEAGMDEAVDHEIEAWHEQATLPESVAGLEALTKLLGLNP